MSRFVLIFRGGGYATGGLSPTELQAHLGRWRAWTDGLLAAGRLSVNQGLAHGGKTVRGYDRVVTDGPYAEAKDLVSGSLILEAASLDEAVELARGCPIFEYDGSVEVRPALSQEAP